MDRETMDRLLIDRRLGELPTDTQRLLDAYLELSPTDAAATEEIETVINLAAQALRPEPTVNAEELSPPSWNTERIAGAAIPQSAIRNPQSAIQKRHWPWPRLLALAASIMLAFFLGTRWDQEPGAPMHHQIARVSSPAPAESMEFWSVARLGPLRSGRAPFQSAVYPRIEWNSPLVWPLVNPPWRDAGEKP